MDGIANVSSKVAEELRQLEYQAENADQRLNIIAEIEILPYIAIGKIGSRVAVALSADAKRAGAVYATPV